MRGPASKERPGQVRAQHRVPPFRRLLSHGPAQPDARVADEDVEPAECLLGRSDSLLGIRRVARVAHDRERAGLLGDRLERLAAAAGDADAVPVCCQAARDCRADAGPASGDERDPHQASAPAGTSERL